MYKIIFHNHQRIYEIYANSVSMSDLFGFIDVSDLVFAEAGQLLVDVAEEKLRAEFQGVEHSLIPMQAIIRIDQVAERGTARISELGQQGNIMTFPGVPTPRRD